MARLHFERHLPYGPDFLLKMVGDVESYPEFIPWINRLRVMRRQKMTEDHQRFDAEASVGFSFLKEVFSTRVDLKEKAHLIEIELLKGPFKKLNCQWKFNPAPEGTDIRFDIDFDFKNPLLDHIFRANFDKAVSKLMQAFENRARQLADLKS